MTGILEGGQVFVAAAYGVTAVITLALGLHGWLRLARARKRLRHLEQA